MDIPDSLCEVVLSFWLLVATHTALGHLAAFASDALSVPEQPGSTAKAVSDSDGPDGTRSGVPPKAWHEWHADKLLCCSAVTIIFLAVLNLCLSEYALAFNAKRLCESLQIVNGMLWPSMKVVDCTGMMDMTMHTMMPLPA